VELDSETFMYTCGQNSYGELGHQHTEERFFPEKVEFMVGRSIVRVAAGNEHTAVLTDTGEVFTCGYNDSGQCGIGTVGRVNMLRRVDALEGKGVVNLVSSNGCEHLVAVTEDGQVYSCGYNARGQLGHGSKQQVTVPRLVESLAQRRVLKVACSYYHTILATDADEIFACGRNDFGQLGVGTREETLRPEPVPFFQGKGAVLSLACGQYHTLVSTSQGGVYAFGKNDYGQLGIESHEPRHVPHLVAEPLADAVVTHLACGYYHTCAVTSDEVVYTFGRNDYGQLGLGHHNNSRTPSRVTVLDNASVIDITCGCYHSIALSRKGVVYSFGRNNHGQLGLGDTTDAYVPQIVGGLSGQFIAHVAAGFYHTIFLAGANPNVIGATKSEKTLAFDLKKLLNNPARSDVTFIVNGQPIYAHRCIIMSRCEPLERMLDGPMRESQQNEIVLHEQIYDVYLALLEYLYTDRVEGLDPKSVQLEFALDLLAVADQYLLDPLKRMCEKAIHKSIDVDNVAYMLATADARQAHELRKKCFDFIMRHFGKVIGTKSFTELSKELLEEILFAASKRGVYVR
jgi:RCC1 and BTB domain-containing protein